MKYFNIRNDFFMLKLAEYKNVIYIVRNLMNEHPDYNFCLPLKDYVIYILDLI